MSADLAHARRVLANVFGYHDFIGKQAEVISQLLGGGSALALMPTGGGKSLCYQLPALLMDGTAIVISPLIALMKDQVDALAQYNVRAASLNSAQGAAEARQVYARLHAGDLDLLYIAPERLMNESGIALLRRLKIALIAIDEAHCISQWGHDFRREYLQLGELAGLFPEAPRLALTATADRQTRQEIIEKLHLQNAQITVASFDRKNIRYHIHSKDNTRRRFLEFYRSEHSGQSGIIYCLSRRRAEETAQWLESEGVPALPYHAGMAAKTRASHQEQFLHRDGMIVCATVAFGMGINKPDVRFVAHFDLPKSIEGYYQETGRAGRDGLAANAVLYYGLGDAVSVRKLIGESGAPEHIRRIEHQKLNALIALCEAGGCRRALLLEYFGEAAPARCGNCDNCIAPPQVEDGTVAAQKFLSAAARSGQLFGAAHLVDIVRGKVTEKIQKFAHDRLPTFGVGADISAAQWRKIARQLISQGLMQPDEEHGSLKITAAGREVLRGEQKVSLRSEAPRAGGGRAQPARAPRTRPDADLDDAQRAAFESLRGERQRLAKAQGVPAYIVFHDTVLIALARGLPVNKDDFAATPGIGAAKAERYAEAFIKVIKKIRENSA